MRPKRLKNLTVCGTYLNSLQRVFSDPPNRENVRPHSGSFIGKLQPHYSQPSRENVIPSSSTSPLAYYKEVPAWIGLCLGGGGGVGGRAYKRQFMLRPFCRKLGKRFGSPFTTFFVPLVLPTELRDILN